MRKSRLYWPVQRTLIGLFIEGAITRDAAEAAGVNKNTANSYFNRLRKLIVSHSAEPGFIEADIDLRGSAIRQVIRKSREGYGIRPFGLVFKGDTVQIALLPDQQLKGDDVPIRDRTTPDKLILHSRKTGQKCASLNHCPSRDILRINECAYHECPMKARFGAEHFCNFFSKHLKKFYGIPEKHLHLYLKECEWKFNNPDKEQQREQLTAWAMRELGQVSTTESIPGEQR